MRVRAAAIRGLAAAATLVLAGTGAAYYGGGFQAVPGVAAAHPSAEANRPSVRESAPRVRLANSGGNSPFAFLESLFGLVPQIEPRRLRRQERYRRVPQQAPRRVPPQEPVAAVPDQSAGGTFRTMCVRLCDGYYWPVSFATLEDRFARDARTCATSCSGSVALYYYPNPGGELEDMVSLEGRPYTSLSTAFLYRTTYDPSCKCRAHPWEEAAVKRHKGYAKSGPVRAAAHGARRRR